MLEIKINKIINSQDCFSCHTPCCRFLLKDKYFAPIATDIETNNIYKKTGTRINFKQFKKNKNIFQVRLKKSKKTNIYLCPFLNEETNECQVYDCRPLDCALWPFILVKKNREIFLSRMRKKLCPSLKKISNKKFLNYMEYLKSKKMINELRNLIKKYPGLAWEWEKDFICLYKLHLD